MKRVTAAVLFALTFFALLSGCPANRANESKQSENESNTNREGGNIVASPYERFFKLSDFSEIYEGMSGDEIKERLGEPSGFVGSGIVRDRYALEDGGAVDLLIKGYDEICLDMHIWLGGRFFEPDGIDPYYDEADEISYERFFKLSDFSDIDIGTSKDEIDKLLGEPSGVVGSGICWDRYALEGGGFVDILIGEYEEVCVDIRIVLPNGRIFSLRRLSHFVPPVSYVVVENVQTVEAKSAKHIVPYIQIKNCKDAELQKRVNAILISAAADAFAKDQREWAGIKYMEFFVTCQSEEYLSVLYKIWLNQTRPDSDISNDTAQIGITIDMKTGERVFLDYFVENEEQLYWAMETSGDTDDIPVDMETAEKVFAAASMNELEYLEQKEAEGYHAYANVIETLACKQGFYLTPKSLVVIRDTYYWNDVSIPLDNEYLIH